MGFPAMPAPVTVAVSVLTPGDAPSAHFPTCATPLPLAVAIPPVTLPPPEATAKVTVAFGTGLFPASVTRTAGLTLAPKPTSPGRLLPAYRATWAGAPIASEVAVKATGLPAIPVPVTVATSVSVPTLPSVQLPTVATPLALVTWVAPVIEPLPAGTENVTPTPGTGLLKVSFTTTAGGVVTVAVVVTDWPSPACLATLLAAPGLAVALKGTGIATPGLPADTLWVPETGPSVQVVRAWPLTSVVADGVPTLPPPPLTEKVTVAPATACVVESFTCTTSGCASALPTVADCASPETLRIPAPTCATVTAALWVAVPEVAVTCALPFATAVAKPVVLPTVATAASVDAHDTTAADIACPRWSFTTPVNCWLLPMAPSVALGGLMVIVVATLAGSVPLLPQVSSSNGIASAARARPVRRFTVCMDTPRRWGERRIVDDGPVTCK